MGQRKASVDQIWERRLQRAAELSRSWPWARELLGFFQALTGFQRDLAARLPAPPPPDLGFLVRFFPVLLDLVERQGPAELAGRAQGWRDRGEEEWRKALDSFWRGERGDPVEEFFPKAVLQPHAFELARRSREEKGARPEAELGGTCPFCGHPPAASLLREAAGPEGTARSLLCSLCSLEWGFPRILCPGCQEERPEKLPRTTAEEIPWVRVEACATCRRYLKAVDLTKNPSAEPVADELAAAPLDLLARAEGYEKFEPNLAGI